MGVVAWTTAAHSDWFTRNIIAGYVPTSQARAEFTTNAPTWQWPTISDLTSWMTMQGAISGLDSGPKAEAAGIALAAAVSRISERVEIQVQPVDADGVVDPAGPPVEIPAEIHLAVLMQAHRWYRRAMSPDGVLGAGEVQGVIRTSGLDFDIENLLSNYTIPGLA